MVANRNGMRGMGGEENRKWKKGLQYLIFKQDLNSGKKNKKQ